MSEKVTGVTMRDTNFLSPESFWPNTDVPVGPRCQSVHSRRRRGPIFFL